MNRKVRNALIVCTRRIGDVLLATPLVQSLKADDPKMNIDMLVFEGTQGILSRSEGVRRVWTVARRPSAMTHLALLRSLWNQYDLALSVLPGDRPTFYSWVAGRYRIGTMLPDRKSWWKRLILHEWIPFDNLSTHTVAMNLRLLGPLDVAPVPTPAVSWREEDEKVVGTFFHAFEKPVRYAVLHVSPKFVYKAWTTEGWVVLGRWLQEQGLAVVLTGGSSTAEKGYVEQVLRASKSDWIDVSGQVELPSVAALLNRASLYVGTDTAVSHIAAAVGTPTIILFGPSNPVKWGPWPKDFPASASSPWQSRGSQRQGNVFLIQGEGDCVPCLNEGCERHIYSVSQCLQTLPAQRIIDVARSFLHEYEEAVHAKAVPVASAGLSGTKNVG